MILRIICVGKRHNQSIVAAIDDYTNRLQKYAKVEWILVPPVQSSNIQQQINSESTTLLGKIKPDDYTVLLDENGRQFNNHEFASALEQVKNHGQSTLVFIIGGAYGVNDSVKIRANLTWSLSYLVFPHQLMRLIVVEQLYRTFSLSDGHPYHHQ